MIIRVTLDILTVLTAISSLITTHLESLRSKNFEEIYPPAPGLAGFVTLRMGDAMLFKLPATYTKPDAITQCRTHMADLYSINKRDDLEKLFTHFQISEIWSAAKVTASGLIIDDNSGHATEVATTAKETVSLPTGTIEGTAGLALKKRSEAKTFEIIAFPASTVKNTICELNLSFPESESGLGGITLLRDQIRQKLTGLLTKVTDSRNQIYSILKTLPRFVPSEEVSADSIVNMETIIHQKLMPIRNAVEGVTLKWDTLSHELDLLGIAMEVDYISDQISIVLGLCIQPFLSPRTMLSYSSITTENLASKRTLELDLRVFEKREIYIFLNEQLDQDTGADEILLSWATRWSDKRSTMEISIGDIVVGILCLFSFFFNSWELISGCFKRRTLGKGEVKRLNRMATSSLNQNIVRPTVRQISYRYPVSVAIPGAVAQDGVGVSPLRVTHQAASTLNRPIIKEFTYPACAPCEDRRSYPATNNTQSGTGLIGLRGQSRDHVPVQRQLSLLSLTDM